VESAMSRVASGTAGAGLLADRGDGVFRSVADEVVIAAGLAVAGHVDLRSRVLAGVVTVAAVLGLCLFRRENYDLVLVRVLAGSRRRVIDGGPPTGQALSRPGPGSPRRLCGRCSRRPRPSYRWRVRAHTRSGCW
jgi:hypothetical protein